MAYVKTLINSNFLQYASYVIRDRAIPDLEDGLKPVQRRILHSLFEMDDGKFHKVANVVGHCMKYHPHGDASIYSALVVLANKELFIEKQGNFGNLFTGDEASAARYIECRISSLAKEILYKPEITAFMDSYDGRNREPVAFPSKLPMALVLGAEGIAVGMSTRILPHNIVEVIKAEIACLHGKKFRLLPDFPTGGYADISGYEDGNGKILTRAKFDLSDPKRILVKELPFGSTTESLIVSVENAAKMGRIKIASISDFTTENVEIEIKLQRGTYADEVVDSLYAFTDCEQSVSCNLLVIKDNLPVQMKASEVVEYHAKRLISILKAELELEEKELRDRLHAKTLEQIFIEKRIYKKIEQQKTQEGVLHAVLDGLKPFQDQIRREVTAEDVERLLKIPIRRISLYDINRAKEEMKEIRARLKEIAYHLAHITEYAIGFLEGIAKKTEKEWKRKTEIVKFTKVDAREVVKRDVTLRYDSSTGYLGTSVSSGEALFPVSSFDRILVVRRNGVYTIMDIPERLFVDSGMWHCAIAEKEKIGETTFSVVYKEEKNGYPYIKRCVIETYIPNRDYLLIPDKATILYVGVEEKIAFSLRYTPKPKARVREENFKAEDYPIKGLKAQGTRLAMREVAEFLLKTAKKPKE